MRPAEVPGEPMEHVLIRKLDHLRGGSTGPAVGFAVETRDRPGPVYKAGAFQDDVVWVQLHGGLFVARAAIRMGWVGEYFGIEEVRARTRGTPLHDLEDFWKGRPRVGYAAVASLAAERWVKPFWAGPRTYSYEWVVLENDRKRASWLDPKESPRGGTDLERRFREWMAAE